MDTKRQKTWNAVIIFYTRGKIIAARPSCSKKIKGSADNVRIYSLLGNVCLCIVYIPALQFTGYSNGWRMIAVPNNSTRAWLCIYGIKAVYIYFRPFIFPFPLMYPDISLVDATVWKWTYPKKLMVNLRWDTFRSGAFLYVYLNVYSQDSTTDVLPFLFIYSPPHSWGFYLYI